MNYSQLPVPNARVAITALDTTPQTVFTGVAGSLGSIIVSDIHAYAAGTTIFRAQDSNVYASGTITFTGLPLDGEGFVVGASSYNLWDSLTPAVGEIQIGADATETAANVAAAINGDANNTANASVTAVANAGVVTLTAIADGTAGNVTLTEALTNATVSGAGTLTGGADLEYFRVTVAGNGTQSIKLPLAFPAAHGLEVLTTAATGVGITVFYHQPGAKGLGV